MLALESLFRIERQMKMHKAKILIIEDDPDGRRSVTEAIQDAGFEVTPAASGKEGVKLFQEGEFDAVLSDLVLPDFDGIEVLSQIIKMDSQMPVLIMTAYGSISSSVKALKTGAYDYITKPLDIDDLQSKITRAVETRRLRKEVSELHKTISSRYSASSIIAKSPGMLEVIRQIGALSDTNATVLISGESGTGKELVARALHVDGKRNSGPFIAVNCGAFTESLLESQLFGHEKGSFTGATSMHKGAFERADDGTLFLDEIGDAPKSVQIKLLRVLEEREIPRIVKEYDIVARHIETDRMRMSSFLSPTSSSVAKERSKSESTSLIEDSGPPLERTI